MDSGTQMTAHRFRINNNQSSGLKVKMNKNLMGNCNDKDQYSISFRDFNNSISNLSNGFDSDHTKSINKLVQNPKNTIQSKSQLSIEDIQSIDDYVTTYKQSLQKVMDSQHVKVANGIIGVKKNQYRSNSFIDDYKTSSKPDPKTLNIKKIDLKSKYRINSQSYSALT